MTAHDMTLIIGVSVAVAFLMVLFCACFWYRKCRRDATDKRYAKYEASVKKSKAKVAARAEERRTVREEREAELRGKYGLFKDNASFNKSSRDDTRTALLENGNRGSRY